MRNLDEFTQAYLEAALWSSYDSDDEPLDYSYGIEDIHPDTLAEMKKDCEEFQGRHWEDIQNDLSAAGYDFWLTRNSHGAGFWDGDWEKEIGERLTQSSKEYGEVYLYVGDDGKIYS